MPILYWSSHDRSSIFMTVLDRFSFSDQVLAVLAYHMCRWSSQQHQEQRNCLLHRKRIFPSEVAENVATNHTQHIDCDMSWMNFRFILLVLFLIGRGMLKFTLSSIHHCWIYSKQEFVSKKCLIQVSTHCCITMMILYQVGVGHQ